MWNQDILDCIYKAIDDVNEYEYIHDGNMWILTIKEILGISGKLGMPETLQKAGFVATCIFGTMIGCVPQ
jgi:uncharacterized protein (DUF39 family)